MDRFTSRKLLFFTALSIVFTFMQIKGYLPADAEVYAQLMMWTMVGYAGGNVGEHFANRGKAQ